MDGVVVIDKPAGKTSHDVVSEVKRIMGARKAGHTGTLDPMATGVLPVCLDEATKLAGFFSDEGKEYLATMKLGVKTDTLDTEGIIIGTSDKQVTEEEVRGALKKMVGKISQVPPAYSAVKYQGEPLYKWARRGVFVEKAARNVEIYEIEVLHISLPEVTFKVSCSKGTYIRTLCSDVGENLGCGACLSKLRRLKSGFFSEEMAVSLDNGGRTNKKEELQKKIVSMASTLPALASLEITNEAAEKLLAGFQPSAAMMKSHVLPFLESGDMIKLTNSGGCLVAIIAMLVATVSLPELEDKCQAARIVRVFNNWQN